MENEKTVFDLEALLGVKLGDIPPAKLAEIMSGLSKATAAVQERQAEIRKSAETEVFAKIAEFVGKQMAEALGWQKLPRVMLTPDADGKVYTVGYPVDKQPKAKADGTTSTRKKGDVNTGDITINKIGVLKGGIEFFVDMATNKKYAYSDIKQLVMDLKQPKDGKQPGASESTRCWEISKQGLSLSDILTKYHPGDITLIYTNGDQQLLSLAIADVEAARKAADSAAKTPAPPAPPAQPEI